MKKNIFFGIVLTCVFLLGIGIQRYFLSSNAHAISAVSDGNQKKPLYWVAPMDPTYRRDKPGKSPMGMDMVPVFDESSQEGIVTISPEITQNLGVRTALVKRLSLPRQINTVGFITVDENQIEHVHTYTDGWVRRLLVKTTGEHVAKGQLLLELYSPTLINAQEEYVLALKSGNKSLLDAAHKKLMALGVAESQIEVLKKTKKSMQLIKIFANQGGIVSKLDVREGKYVKPDYDLITLEGLSCIWVIAEVFEKQSQWVHEGQPAEATLPYLPGKKWVGKVDYVYPRLDIVTHTLKVRLRFDNPSEILKPNMYADVTIYAASEDSVLAIPREAVIYTGDGARVIVQLAQGKYQAKTVQLGIESGDNIAVLSGLIEGEAVVTSGQFLIDSESSLKASFERLSGEKSNMNNIKLGM